MKNKGNIIIIRDTREQRGLSFNGYEVIDKALPTGDYSLLGYENYIVVERKRVNELFGCFGADRDRFIKEIKRMQKIPYKFIVVEGAYNEIDEGKRFSKMSTKVVKGSINSLRLRYNVHVIFAGNKENAEGIILDLFTKFNKYINRGDII